jgi:hypothetical protein
MRIYSPKLNARDFYNGFEDFGVSRLWRISNSRCIRINSKWFAWIRNHSKNRINNIRRGSRRSRRIRKSRRIRNTKKTKKYLSNKKPAV